MAGFTIPSIFAVNPATSNQNDDLFYFVRTPYNSNDDFAINWQNFSVQFASNVLTTKGDLYTYSTVAARLGVGTDGQILQALSSQTTGLQWTSTLSSTVQGNITQLGTIASGTWHGTVIGSTYGGTGVNNGASTITIGGNVTFSGAFTFAGTLTGNTAVTFPTSGTLATTSQLPSGAALTKTDDTNVTLTLGGTPATALLQATSLTLGWTGTLSGTRGGTGVNNGSNTATFAGNLNFANSFTTSGNFAVTQTYTNTTNVTFPTSGTLATTSQLNFTTWNDVSGTTQSAAVNNGYIISNASQTTVTLPATAAEGSVFAVQGKGAGGWILQANTGQIIHLGSSATSSAGSLTSTNQWDSVTIVCVTTNTTFAVTSLIGNLTVA